MDIRNGYRRAYRTDLILLPGFPSKCQPQDLVGQGHLLHFQLPKGHHLNQRLGQLHYVDRRQISVDLKWNEKPIQIEIT